MLPYRLYFIPKNFTNKQVHHRINEYYAPFSKINDYEQQVIAVDKKDQPLRLLMIPTSRYATCEFCGKKNCDGCVLKYSDELFINTVDSFLRMDKKI